MDLVYQVQLVTPSIQPLQQQQQQPVCCHHHHQHRRRRRYRRHFSCYAAVLIDHITSNARPSVCLSLFV